MFVRVAGWWSSGCHPYAVNATDMPQHALSKSTPTPRRMLLPCADMSPPYFCRQWRADHPEAMVLFYSPSCPHCVKAAPMYKEAAREAKKLMLPPFAAVNCGRNQEVCGGQAKGVPTLRFFSSSSWDPNAGTFYGPRTAVALVQFVQLKAKTRSIPEDPSEGYVCFDETLPQCARSCREVLQVSEHHVSAAFILGVTPTHPPTFVHQPGLLAAEGVDVSGWNAHPRCRNDSGYFRDP